MWPFRPRFPWLRSPEGSVSSKEVAELIKKQLGYEFDKKKIIMKDAAKGLGGYEVGIKLHPEVTAQILLDVQEEK